MVKEGNLIMGKSALIKMQKYKPDYAAAIDRWEAYWEGDMLDRPLLIYQNNYKDFEWAPGSSYKDRCFGDMDEILDNYIHNLSGTDFMGDGLPSFWISLGTHEIASYMGAELAWAGDSDTNWIKHNDGEFKDILPIALDENNHFYKRMLSLYEKAVKRFDGASQIFTLDNHTNMDLLLSLRGDANLCIDTFDCPELIDEAMVQVAAVFKKMFADTSAAGQFDKYGYSYDTYSAKSNTTLACDFSALVGKEMFRRWILPTMEYEASLIERVRFHWDGPDALRHFDDIMGIKKLHTISFVPNPFEKHIKYLDLYKKIQSCGKCVEFGGNMEEIKAVAKELLPNKTIYRLQGDYTRKQFSEFENYLKKL